MYNFLFVNNTNLHPVSRRLQDIADYVGEISVFSLSTEGTSVYRVCSTKFTTKAYLGILNRSGVTRGCERQTERRPT